MLEIFEIERERDFDSMAEGVTSIRSMVLICRFDAEKEHIRA